MAAGDALGAEPPQAEAPPGRLAVAIIGTGLVGASLGLALSRLPQVGEVVGYDGDPGELGIARERGALSATAPSAAAAAARGDVVVLAVPVSAVPEVAAEAGPALRPGTILTDVASVKRPVVEALQAAVPTGVHIVGGHPMAGSHETGAAHASADLFVGATYLLTPTTHTDAHAYRRLHGLLSAIGARVLAVRPERHDLLVAVTSHLPQLAATTLMNLAAERARDVHGELLLLAAGGFRDATRVAASNPELWMDICAENRQAIIEVLDDYRERIGALRSVLAVADDEGLRQALMDARLARRSLPGKESATGALVELFVPIPDHPGVLAEVTTTVGGAGVNIEDLGIEHAPEGGRGLLRVAIMGPGSARRAREALQARGYEVRERQP